MELLPVVLASGWASGINAYLVVLVLGLIGRFTEVAGIPEGLTRTDVLVVAAVMYLVELVADKIPYFDSLWDAIHTAIRPIGGALIAVTTLGDASPATKALVALLGGAVAASSHLTKTSTRAAANASPEPFSNWILSLGEDVFAVGLGYTALTHPVAALVIAVVVLALIAVFAVVIVRTVRRWLRRRRPAPLLPDT